MRQTHTFKLHGTSPTAEVLGFRLCWVYCSYLGLHQSILQASVPGQDLAGCPPEAVADVLPEGEHQHQ